MPAGEVHSDQRGNDDAEGQHELEDGGPPAAAGGRETLRQVQRDHHGDDAARQAHQQASQEQDDESLRGVNEQNADHEYKAGGDHDFLASGPIREDAATERGDHRPAEDRGDNEGSLPFTETDGLVQVQQGRGNDPDIDPDQQAAQTRNEKQVRQVPSPPLLAAVGTPLFTLVSLCMATSLVSLKDSLSQVDGQAFALGIRPTHQPTIIVGPNTVSHEAEQAVSALEGGVPGVEGRIGYPYEVMLFLVPF